MSRERDLLEHAVCIGGVPRSGTTFLARSLNSHPDFVLSADDHVLESWGLYYYRTRVGIVDGLRRGAIGGEEAVGALARHLFGGGTLFRAVPSEKVLSFSPSAPPPRPDGIVLEEDEQLQRHDIPLGGFSPAWRLCLKSPEITYILGDLAALLPSAQFVMVYRPLIEVAGSMYRMGEQVKKVKIFHRRWREEKDEGGRLAAPPGVPAQWAALWHEVSDFQRCVINGASYLKALVEAGEKMPQERLFICSHKALRKDPRSFFHPLAAFLGVDLAGFENAMTSVRGRPFVCPDDLAGLYRAVAGELALDRLEGRTQLLTAP